MEFDGADVTDIPPAKRGLAMVLQSYALYPHMSVRENIAFPLRMAKVDNAEQDRRVESAPRVLNPTEFLERCPRQLSGGQGQRVAIGRAIVREPAAFLFDEPLSNLDAALRVNMRLEISELRQSLKTTMINATHDQDEAMTIADKIVVQRAGVIELVGSPMELYPNPRNQFIAGFIGSPRTNFLSGGEAEKHDAPTIGIRPEHFATVTDGGARRGTVGVSEHLGPDTFFHVRCEDLGATLTIRADGDNPLQYGDSVSLLPEAGRLHRFDQKVLRIFCRGSG